MKSQSISMRTVSMPSELDTSYKYEESGPSRSAYYCTSTTERIHTTAISHIPIHEIHAEMYSTLRQGMQFTSPGHHLPNHCGALVDLADYARKLVQRFVADFYEGRYSLAVPIKRGKSCVEYCLEVLKLS